MVAVGALAYAQARMQARLGRRPQESVWQAIEHAREAESLLELVRDTTLHAPLSQLGLGRSIHAVEAGMRGVWRASVAELAAWMPPEWGQAIHWCGVVPELPWLRHWASGGAIADWMSADLRWRALLEGARQAGPSLPPGHEFAPLGAALGSPASLASAWTAEFKRRLPAHDAASLAPLARVVDQYFAHALQVGGPDAPRLRQRFEMRLLGHFRRHSTEAAAAFAWLGLTALDLDRLRGELVLRLALPARSFAS